MDKHPIPKRASLRLEPVTVDVPNTTKVLSRPARSIGCTPVLFGAGVILILYVVWNAYVIPTYTNVTDSFAYGKARISEVTQDVGHGGESTFIGLVENGQIVVIELVGTPPSA